MTMTAAEELQDLGLSLFPYEESDDPDRKTHIVAPSDNPEICHALSNDGSLTGQDVVDHARFNGLEVTALCGYTWVPKHNPEKYDICEKCLKEAQRRMGEAGE